MAQGRRQGGGAAAGPAGDDRPLAAERECATPSSAAFVLGRVHLPRPASLRGWPTRVGGRTWSSGLSQSLATAAKPQASALNGPPTTRLVPFPYVLPSRYNCAWIELVLGEAIDETRSVQSV